MSRVFQNSKGELAIFDDAELAVYYGFTKEVNTVEPNVKTGVYYVPEKRELSEEEYQKLRAKTKDIYENIEKYSTSEIKEFLEDYKFLIDCSYRGGEKTAEVVVSVFEDPIEKAMDWNDWEEMWICEPMSSLYYQMKDIAESKSLI